MDTLPAFTDDDILRIASAATLRDFYAAAAPLQDNPHARKAVMKLLRDWPKTHVNWQKNEAMRLHRELAGAEPTVATVLQAEVSRFNNRLGGRDFTPVNGLTVEYEAGFLEALEKKLANGAPAPAVHKAFMDAVAEPVFRTLRLEGARIQRRRAKYNDVRMTISRGPGGAPECAVWSEAERTDEAEKTRQMYARATKVAEMPDIGVYITAVLAQGKDGNFRKAVKEQLGSTAEDPLLGWQKREVIAMMNKGETPDEAALQIVPRLDAALEGTRLQFEQQFKKAVKQVPVIAGPDLRRKLCEAAFNPAATSVQQVVTDSFVTPLVIWMRENWESVSAQALKFPDTQVIVNDLPAANQPMPLHLYSARDAWQKLLKQCMKTSEVIAAPRTASFRRLAKTVI